LYDPLAEDPYHLFDVLGEEAMDQVMSRRSALGASPPLVRAIVRTHVEDTESIPGIPARDVFRESLTRLLRITAFTDLDAAEESELGLLVRQTRAEARASLVER